MDELEIKKLLKKSLDKGLSTGELDALIDHLESCHGKPIICASLSELWEQFEAIGFKHPLKERLRRYEKEKEGTMSLEGWL